MNILLIEAQLVKFNRLKDGSVNYGFHSLGELTKEAFSLTDDYYQKTGHMAFKTDEITLSDIPDSNTKVPGKRSPSYMLRQKIIALHYKKGGTKDDLGDYYEKVMAGFEVAVQEQIDEIEN